MSLIDLEKNKVVGQEGIKRTLDENSVSLILDTISIDQYMLPEQSIVRELTANAIDSQKEKDQAIAILNGDAKIEDYYIKRDDPKYKDSNFNKDYYKLECLNRNKNKVELIYIEGKDGVGWCDIFTVKDYGVGLGDDRLYGYLNAGYSTKRNNLYTLGSFGFGAKVGLSLRNDYYITTTVHNNRKFKLQCYSYKVDSMIGKFNSKGEENKFITFKDNSKVYYEDTTELNYTEVSLPCKTHHKSKFYNAVKAQLLYFDNVDFKVIDKTGRIEDVDFQANVLYNSENLIIADQYQYSRPHIVVVKDKKTSVGTCYGYANFKEMEMQELYSSIGFKCPIRQVVRNADGSITEITPGIEVTSSRENVIWSDTTRAYVKGIIDKAKDEASTLVEKQLDEKDFLQWLYKANNVLNKGDDKILRSLAGIIDTTDLSPAYPGDKSIKYGSPKALFWGLSVRYNEKIHNYKEKKDEIQRRDVESWGYFPIDKVYLQIGNTQTTKDFYLTHTIGNFITIRVDSNEELFKYVKDNPTNDQERKWTKEYIQKLIDKRDKILKYLQESKQIKNYDEIEVPEEWSKKFESQIKNIQEAEIVEKLSPAELRKLDERTIVSSIYPEKWKNDKRLFAWEKHEPKISEFIVDESDVYYGFQEDEETIDILGVLMAKQFEQYKPKKDRHTKYYNEDIKIVRVSKSMPKKYLKKHKYIGEFFKSQLVLDKNVGMSKYLVKWNTARLISEKLGDLKFFENYKNFNGELYDYYQEIKSYSLLNYTKVDDIITKYTQGKQMLDSIIEYSNKVNELQLFIREHQDKTDDIKQKSNELFGLDTIEEAIGLDLDVYDKLQVLLDYSEPIKPLFNQIECLIKKVDIDFETETLIKEIIHNKDLHNYKINVSNNVTSSSTTELIEVIS